MRVLHIGGFDAENYGDLLFPLILARRLAGVSLIHATPSGTNPGWLDCAPTTSITSVVSGPQMADAVVLGGGGILTDARSTLPLYNRDGVSGSEAYPSMWRGVAECAKQWRIPSCWNAPGSPRPFRDEWRGRLRSAADSVGYLTVRDRHSADILGRAGVARTVAVVPDTAFDVSMLWSDESLDASYTETVDSHCAGRTMVVHVTSRRTHETTETLAGRILRMAQATQATPILLALGPCHGDGELQRHVAARLGCAFLLVDTPVSMRQIAACIARSVLYVGSSLHGFITALSFGVPALVVAPERSSGLRKYSGCLEHCEYLSGLKEEWAQAEEAVLKSSRHLSELQPPSLSSVRRQLDIHWAALRHELGAD